MKFSEHWLRSLVDPPIDSTALADALTMAGLEVEERVPAAPAFSGVVAGRIVSFDRHPNADRLTVCSVDVGRAAPLSIVCGAPNVAAGIVVPCALVGARLPGDVTIKASQMRGVESQGMLCSARELGIADDASGLLLLDADIASGTDLRKALDLDDWLITLKLTPNRADCLSLVGIAREVSAITRTPFATPARAKVAETATATRAVRIDNPQACPRFCGRVIEGIDARAPTPAWMRQRLERSGIRPISAVVDVTNYVMLEMGQPLHAYDDAHLEGDIVVRFARAGERLTLLNGEVLDLDPSLLLVTDDAKALGLAGIMGGEHSSISDSTTRVYLEGAFWTPSVIQGKARRLGFATDAGYRFERGVDFAASPAAVDRATGLILEICGGRAGPLSDIASELPRRDPVRVRVSRINRVLGVDIPAADVEAIFARLGLAPRREGDAFIVTPPSYRFDLAIEADFIEEVARLYGFDRIETAAPAHRQRMLPAAEALRPVAQLRERMVGRDYQEVITFSFVDSAWEHALRSDPPPTAVLNPIASHLNVMRTTLLGGLLDVLRTNVNRKADRVRIFETGRCFVRDAERLQQPPRIGGLVYGTQRAPQWSGDGGPVDFFDIKGDVEALAYPLEVRTVAAEHAALHPGRSARVLICDRMAGWVGELHPRLARTFDLPRSPMVFELDLDSLTTRQLPAGKPVSRLPIVRRDLAVLVDENVPAQEVLEALRRVQPPQVEHVSLFDVYRGPGIEPGRKSLAILVLIQDTARTLTDAEIDAAVRVLLRELENRFNATLRQ